jgi:hypothetical protein
MDNLLNIKVNKKEENNRKDRIEIAVSIPKLLLVTGSVQNKIKADDVSSCVAEREANGTWYLETF